MNDNGNSRVQPWPQWQGQWQWRQQQLEQQLNHLELKKSAGHVGTNCNRLDNHQSKSTLPTCGRCDQRFCSQNWLQQHIRTVHIDGSIITQGTCEEIDLNSPTQAPVYECLILDLRDLQSLLDEVRSTEDNAFKIHVGFGCMLYDTVYIYNIYIYIYIYI